MAIDTSLSAQRQLELAPVHLAERRWEQAADLLRQVTINDARSLVRLEPGRYLNAAVDAQLLAASMPPEGLAVMRKAVDHSAQRAYEEALAARDDAALRTIVGEAFVARASEDAILTLGQWAWESGDVTQARGWWERLRPADPHVSSGKGQSLLRYPDARTPRAEILARLAMCSLLEGDREQADIDRGNLRRLFPQARGLLAGRRGNLPDLLDGVARESQAWSYPPRDDSVSTFGINAARNGVLPREIDVGGLRWTAALTPEASPSDTFALRQPDALSCFPVTFDNLLLANTADQIFAWNVQTGKPAWPVGTASSAAIYPAVTETVPAPLTSLMGSAPQYTLTVSEGRLFARMGSPFTTRPQGELRDSDSSLVCLDLRRQEGKLLWKVDAAVLDPQLAFEGSPLVTGSRAYVAGRRGRPQMQTSVICLDPQSGRRLWEQPVCAAVAEVGGVDRQLSRQLLTAGDHAVFLSTDAGAIAALDAETGTIRWISTYEERAADESLSAPKSSPSPCLFARNIVLSAPSDAVGLWALDSQTGKTLWQRVLLGGIEHLLGVRNGVAVVSGHGLWGLELATGRTLWHVGFTDPASFGYGRGILAGDVVYWPTREEIFVADQESGVLRRRIPILARHGETGGNLLLAGESLVVAKRQRIAVFGPESGRAGRTELLSLRSRER